MTDTTGLTPEQIALHVRHIEQRCVSAGAEGRILAAEIERLRAECERRRQWDGLINVVMRGNSDYAQHLRRMGNETERLTDELEDLRVALAASEAREAALAEWTVEEGGWRLFHYAYTTAPVDTFDLTDRFNPDVSDRIRLALAAQAPAGGEGSADSPDDVQCGQEVS